MQQPGAKHGMYGTDFKWGAGHHWSPAGGSVLYSRRWLEGIAFQTVTESQKQGCHKCNSKNP